MTLNNLWIYVGYRYLISLKINTLKLPGYDELLDGDLTHAADGKFAVALLEFQNKLLIKLWEISSSIFTLCLASSQFLGDRTFGKVLAGINLKARPFKFKADNFWSTHLMKDRAYID